MRRGASGSFVLVLAAACALVAPVSASATHYDELLAPKSACPGQGATKAEARKLVRAAVCLHNRARQGAQGRGPERAGKPKSAGKSKFAGELSKSVALKHAAKAKAVDIFRCGEFDHAACGRDPFYWQKKVGYATGCYGVAENLFYAGRSAATPRAAMSAWLHSDLHRQILLDRRYDEVGIAARSGQLGERRARVWVAHFGYRC